MEKKVLGYECKFVIYIPPRDNIQNDFHMVKEKIHYEDGTFGTNLRILKDFEQDYYVTKKNYQNHEDKKDFESLRKVNHYKASRRQMARKVAQSLDLAYMSNPNMRQLSDSPYLYGTDLPSTSFIKGNYRRKFPDLYTPSTVCALDIEVDVNGGKHNGEISVISACMSDKVLCVVNEFLLPKGLSNPTGAILDKIGQYIGDYIQLRDMEIIIEYAKNEMEAIQKIFKHIHEWKPDFLAIWNIDYDLPHLVAVCEKYGILPENVFSDPDIPEYIRYFKYKQGKSRKVKANGKEEPIPPAKRWHVAYSTSSFYFIDAMLVYRQVRLNEAEEQSYSLDAILNKILGIRKLKFKEAEQYTGLEWHTFMSTRYPLEYIVYNIFDTLSMIELDNKINDLSDAVPVMCAYSDYADLNSQPKRLADKQYWFALDNGYVIGTCGTDLRSPIDERTLPLSGWTVTLEPGYMVDNGLRIIIEYPHLHTQIRLYGSDSDILSAYPSCQVTFNVSRGTTRTELIEIKGVDKFMSRYQNINLIAGEVNAVDYCQFMFNFPSMQEVAAQIRNRAAG